MLTEPQLTEPQAWRAIARQVHADERNLGLCVEVELLYSGDCIDEQTKNTMRTRIRSHLRPGTSWAYPSRNFAEYRKYRDARILAALFFAHEAEDEGSARPNNILTEATP
jgi:hypothetical protein